jgi:mRNA-degrading endonuclease HigB of HigAB toxin-antitoxin module
MKVHLIKRQTIEEFVLQHARSRTSFADWLEKIKRADWKEPGTLRGRSILLIYWAKEATGSYLISRAITIE